MESRDTFMTDPSSSFSTSEGVTTSSAHTGSLSTSTQLFLDRVEALLSYQLEAKQAKYNFDFEKEKECSQGRQFGLEPQHSPTSGKNSAMSH